MPLKKISYLHLATVVLGAIGLAACDGGTAQAPVPPPPSVAIKEIKAEPVPLRYEYAGRVAAFREVEIRARVSGILQEKTFVEGDAVKAGDVMFRIDPAPYEAELARTKAQLMEAQAQLARTQRDAERATTLYQKQFGSEKSRDDAVSAYELARASVAGAEAQVRTAEINLGYTTITAPISGIASSRMLPEGSLVGTSAADSLLTRISQLDPVYVHFSFSHTEATEIRRLIDSGEAKGPADGRLLVRVSVGDGKTYEHLGHVDFTDSNLDLQTGTLRARAVVPNPNSLLRPGEFVRVSIEGITRKDTIVIPHVALMQSPQGQFVYALDKENKAAIRPVKIGREVEGGWIVENGLDAGERIITEGMIKVRPGAPVTIASADAATTKAASQ